MSKYQFFMVYVEGGNSPSHKHPTWESANSEAIRLAKKEGKTTHILQAVMGYENPEPVAFHHTWALG